MVCLFGFNFYPTSIHLEELQELNIHLAKDATLPWNRHTEQFAEWIKMRLDEIF